jgi:parvulin-like peptidyl-prolyl isomerase
MRSAEEIRSCCLTGEDCMTYLAAIKFQIPAQAYRYSMAFWLIPLLLTGCGLFDPGEQAAVIVVGSTHISAHKLREDIKFIGADFKTPAGEEAPVKEKLLEQAIGHYLIMEYGKESDITVSEREFEEAFNTFRKGYTEEVFREFLLFGYVDYDQWKQRFREHLLVNKIADKVAEGIDPPSYQEIKRYFEVNKERFREPRMIRFRQIVTRTKKEAEGLLERLHHGEDMADLAKRYSIAPESEKGGEVGWVALGHLDRSIEKVLFSLPQNDFSPVINSSYGYHIFQVLSTRPGGIKRLPDVVREIESILLAQKKEALFSEWIQDLRSRFRVKVNQPLFLKMELS